MAHVELNEVRKTYDHYIAVQSLDLTINDGEFVVLLGPSGCGKTTTLNVIAGLDFPSSGRVLFDGCDVTAEPPHSRNVAMVFQSSLLYPHLSVRQNIQTSLRYSRLSTSERDRRVQETARMLQLEPLLNKLPGQMSGGQRQRAAMAKAIVREPTVFLLDEPLSALDAALRLSLRAELVNLQKRLGTTTVFVTHDQAEAMTMGDRIAVMSNGRLEQIGTPDEIYRSPASLFVAGFLGTPPMNFLRGQIGEGRFNSANLSLALPSARSLAPGAVTLGVRPQHLSVTEAGAPSALRVTVFAMEHLGRESVLIAEDELGVKFRALVEPRFSIAVGTPLGLVPDMTKCMFFGEDDRRIPEIGEVI
jgi:ABC-type sugar transport system ATPase subunit